MPPGPVLLDVSSGNPKSSKSVEAAVKGMQQRVNGSNSTAANSRSSASDSSSGTAGQVFGITHPISWDPPTQYDMKLTSQLEDVLKQYGLYESEEEMNRRYAQFLWKVEIFFTFREFSEVAKKNKVSMWRFVFNLFSFCLLKKVKTKTEMLFYNN